MGKTKDKHTHKSKKKKHESDSDDEQSNNSDSNNSSSSDKSTKSSKSTKPSKSSRSKPELKSESGSGSESESDSSMMESDQESVLSINSNISDDDDSDDDESESSDSSESSPPDANNSDSNKNTGIGTKGKANGIGVTKPQKTVSESSASSTINGNGNTNTSTGKRKIDEVIIQAPTINSNDTTTTPSSDVNLKSKKNKTNDIQPSAITSIVPVTSTTNTTSVTSQVITIPVQAPISNAHAHNPVNRPRVGMNAFSLLSNASSNTNANANTLVGINTNTNTSPNLNNDNNNIISKNFNPIHLPINRPINNNNSTPNNSNITNNFAQFSPQSKIEYICSTYLYSFIKQDSKQRKFEYIKPTPINRYIISNMNKDWMITINPIGRDAVIAFTKTNSFILLKSDNDNSGTSASASASLNLNLKDDFLIYPSMLKGADSIEFIAIGKWCRQEQENPKELNNEIHDCFYPCDLVTFDSNELKRVTNMMEWKSPNLNDNRLSTNIKDRSYKLNSILKESCILKPVHIKTSITNIGHINNFSNNNNSNSMASPNDLNTITSQPISPYHYFKIIPKTISQISKHEHKDIILSEFLSIKNNGIVCISPNHMLNDIHGQYLVSNNGNQTIDLFILPANKPLNSLVSENEWKHDEKDQHGRYIFPLFTNISTKRYDTHSGCSRAHNFDELHFIGRGIIENSIEGEQLQKRIVSNFIQTKDTNKPLTVTCILQSSKNNNNDLWIKELNLNGTPTHPAMVIKTLFSHYEYIDLYQFIDFIYL